MKNQYETSTGKLLLSLVLLTFSACDSDGEGSVSEQCSSNAECQGAYAGMICADRTCVPCSERASCTEGFYCETEIDGGARCIESCATNADCPDDQPICREGSCEAGCRADRGTSGCDDEKICVENVCVEGCREDAQCGDGKICEENLCVEGCHDDQGCLIAGVFAGNICRDGVGRCAAGCREQGQCGEGRVCEESLCIPSCAQDDDCIDREGRGTCHEDGRCLSCQDLVEICEQPGHGGEGYTCDSESGRCSPPCTENIDCDPEAPYCHEHRCIPCSLGGDDLCREMHDEDWVCEEGPSCQQGCPSQPCEHGVICRGGHCASCVENAECRALGEGLICLEGRCISPGCQEESDCGAGLICQNEICIQGCNPSSCLRDCGAEAPKVCSGDICLCLTGGFNAVGQPSQPTGVEGCKASARTEDGTTLCLETDYIGPATGRAEGGGMVLEGGIIRR